MRAEIEQARMSGDLVKASELIQEEAKSGMTVGLLHQHALTFMAAGRYGDALEALLLLASKVPTEGQLWINIGQCAEALGEWDTALHAYDTCLKVPKSEFTARAHFGRGSNLFRLGMHAYGVKTWRKALAIPPRPNETLFMRSQVLLAFGNYEEGWPMYESRRTSLGWVFGVKGHGTDYDNLPPEWDGKSEGPLYVYGEQGAGDNIMFHRYTNHIEGYMGMGPRINCGQALAELLANEAAGEPVWSVPIGSLPFLLGITEPIPPKLIYETPYTNPRNTKPRMGVCWKGSSQHAHDKDRSSPIDFRDALQDERWEIVSLQVGHDFNPKDYLETAELMRTLDAVVTVDTSVVHLAGTLGVPTVLIPPVSPEWRWGIGQETTPWYPSVKIVRRTHVNAWPEALREAKREISKQVL